MQIHRPESRQPIPSHAQCVFTCQLFRVFQWEQILYDGSTAIFEKVKRPDTVLVIATTSDQKIVLIQQEQPGTKQPLICAAGGRIEEKEDVLEAAKRELLEETGYASTDWELWKSEQPETKIDWVL